MTFKDTWKVLKDWSEMSAVAKLSLLQLAIIIVLVFFLYNAEDRRIESLNNRDREIDRLRASYNEIIVRCESDKLAITNKFLVKLDDLYDLHRNEMNKVRDAINKN